MSHPVAEKTFSRFEIPEKKYSLIPEYIREVEKCKLWLENVLQETLPHYMQMEQELCNGVLLAKLAHIICSDLVPKSHIFDIDMVYYRKNGLHFKHIDNINYWLRALRYVKLPKVFHPETMDIYNKKNIPQVIFCIQALSEHLFKLGKATLIEDHKENATFSGNELNTLETGLKQDIFEAPHSEKSIISSDRKLLCSPTFDTNHEVFGEKAEAGESKVYIDKLNTELKEGNVDSFFIELNNFNLGLQLSEAARTLYFEELKSKKLDLKYLTHEDFKNEILFLSRIENVSIAVDENSPDKTLAALSVPLMQIKGIDCRLKEQYLSALSVCKKYKLEHCDCTLLTYTNIQDCIDLVNYQYSLDNHVDSLLNDLILSVRCNDLEKIHKTMRDLNFSLNSCIDRFEVGLLQKELEIKLNMDRVNKLSLADVELTLEQCYLILNKVVLELKILRDINLAVENNDRELLSSLILLFSEVPKEYTIFLAEEIIQNKKALCGTCAWVEHFIPNKYHLFFNLITEEYLWEKPLIKKETSRFLSFTQVQDVVHYWASFDLPSLMVFQAHCRGYLFKKKYSRHKYYLRNISSVIKLQRWWKGVNKKHMKLQSKTISLSNYCGNSLTMCEMEKKILKIQTVWRGVRVRKAFRAVFCHLEPSFQALKLFFRFVDITTIDYERELILQDLRSEIVQAIRRNQNLMKKIDKMDVTIGLLIQNRISVMEAVTEKRSFNFGGLKCLRADSRRLLEGYQNLFYTLQTSPHYLGSLLFCLPQSKSSKFLQSVILTLYNFGANHRNEYLLLKLLQWALREEIRCKFKKPTDAITGNPLVLKMAVNYARQASGHSALRQVLGPLILKVINSKEVSIDTNPVTIYNRWRSEQEMISGKVAELPYSVSQAEALRYEEVVRRLNVSIEQLRSRVILFLKRIRNLKEALPYGLCFIAKELNSALSAKFPDLPTKEILKVVGNLLYYQFINSTIVAPDAFDIITLSPGQTLSSDQRHTLASIAKILQFAATKKGFGEESGHLMCLNPFIIECHEDLKMFFKECCDVEDLDSHYSMTEFTDATLIFHPTIYITLQEIIETHSLLLDYEQEIAPDPDDPLRKLLHDLGPIPSLSQLAGRNNVSRIGEKQIGGTEVCLTLTNKFEVEHDNTDIVQLFIRAKNLICILLPYLNKGYSLPGALRMEFSDDDEFNFSTKKVYSVHSGTVRSLTDCKIKLNKLLQKLTKEGLVAREDGYQNILTAIAVDIRNKGKYRLIQSQELAKMRDTKRCLEEKYKFLLAQVNYYNAYIDRCLENLNAGKRNIHSVSEESTGRNKTISKNSLKYSGAKLLEKGVLISIEGLPQCQLKNVHFEINPTNTNGVFLICGKFMGVEVEKVEVDVQKLLQLQYDGVTVMDMFGKAKVNINLLLYIFNRKYYKKS